MTELEPDVTLQDLLAAGVPWPMVIEAMVIEALDREPDVGTHEVS